MNTRKAVQIALCSGILLCSPALESVWAGSPETVDPYTGMTMGVPKRTLKKDSVRVVDPYSGTAIDKSRIKTRPSRGWIDPMTGQRMGTQEIIDESDR